MFKIYLKKLILTIVFIVAFFIIVGILAFVTYLLFNNMFTGTVQTFAISTLALLFDLAIVLQKREVTECISLQE